MGIESLEASVGKGRPSTKEIRDGDIVFHDRDIPKLEGNFSGVAEWDLGSRNNPDVVSGVYLYVVESAYGKKVGKFVIVR